MAVSLISTGVQFPDNSIQTTAAGASAMVLAATATASSSSEIVFNNLSTTYRAYLVEYDQVYLASNNQNLLMQISTDNGSSYISSNYQRVGFYMTTSTVQGNVETAASFLYIGSLGGWSNSSSRRGAGQVMMFAPNTGGSPQLFTHTSVTLNASGNNEITQMVMQNSSTSAVNAIKFFSSSGNIAAGNFRLYGLVNA